MVISSDKYVGLWLYSNELAESTLRNSVRFLLYWILFFTLLMFLLMPELYFCTSSDFPRSKSSTWLPVRIFLFFKKGIIEFIEVKQRSAWNLLEGSCKFAGYSIVDNLFNFFLIFKSWQNIFNLGTWFSLVFAN